MEICLPSEVKEFLLELVKLASIIGPRELEKSCNEGAKCSLDDDSFYENISATQEFLNEVKVCNGN